MHNKYLTIDHVLNSSDSSQLLTTVALNYDLRTLGTQSYDLTVSVNDTEHVDFLQINILVQDVNDNDPVFSNETYESVFTIIIVVALRLWLLNNL